MKPILKTLTVLAAANSFGVAWAQSYLPTTGGTLTGPLTGTSATFDYVAVAPTTGASALNLNAQAGGNQSTVNFLSSGVGKWQFGRQNDNSFFLYDIAAGRFPFTVSSGGQTTVGENYQITLPPAGGTVFTGPVALGQDATAPDQAVPYRQLYPVVAQGLVGDGVTDDTAAMQAALNNASGKTLVIRKPAVNYHLNTDVHQPSTPAQLIVDPGTTYSGPGMMPGSLTNIVQQTRFNYSYASPEGRTPPGPGGVPGGDATITAEMAPQAGYGGNAVGVYAGARTPVGAFPGTLWGGNVIANLEAGTTLGEHGNAVGLEVDLNTHSGPDDRGSGLTVTGVGAYRPAHGINVFRVGSGAPYLYGQAIYSFDKAAVFVDGAAVNGVTPASPNAVGLLVQNLPKYHVKLVPTADAVPSDFMLYTTNATDTVVTSGTRVDGSTYASSVQTYAHYSVSGLPACDAGAYGKRAMVDDAASPTFLGALTGGGTTKAPAFCDGSSWRAG